jgi:hypothetical protein
METAEWKGLKPQKFNGGLGIVQADYKSCTNFFKPDPEFNFQALENVKSKRHFTIKNSDVAKEWRPSLKMVKSASGNIRTMKITDLPCTTHTKPLRHVEKFSNGLNTKKTLKLNPLNYVKQGKMIDAQEVKNLEMWEKDVLNKRPYQRDAGLRQFRSILEGYRMNLLSMTVTFKK